MILDFKRNRLKLNFVEAGAIKLSKLEQSFEIDTIRTNASEMGNPLILLIVYFILEVSFQKESRDL